MGWAEQSLLSLSLLLLLFSPRGLLVRRRVAQVARQLELVERLERDVVDLVAVRRLP